MVDGVWLFAWGLAGGALAELLNARALRERDRRRWNRERKSPGFWFFGIVFAAAGGLVALAHDDAGAVLTRWLALNVGFTWPLLLRRSIGAAPTTQYQADE